MVCRFAEVTSAAAILIVTEDTLLTMVVPTNVLAALSLILANVSATVMELDTILLLPLIAVALEDIFAILSFIAIVLISESLINVLKAALFPEKFVTATP